jgi:hypothetical protein
MSKQARTQPLPRRSLDTSLCQGCTALTLLVHPIGEAPRLCDPFGAELG